MIDKNKRIKISVIMSVYNGKDYLEQAVNSVLAQTYTEFEFVIIDDCSTDGSYEMLLSIAKLDNRVSLFRNETNQGLTKSLNLGVKFSKGDYIARMDADDICIPQRLEYQLSYILENREVDLLYADTVLIDKNSEVICDSWRPNNINKVLSCLEKHNFIPHPTVIFRKSTFNRIGGYNENCRTGQDVDLWLRMRDQECHFGYLNKIVLMYRLNPSSVRSYLSDYWFSIANCCVWNGSKFRALNYFKYLCLKEKTILTVKILMPFSYFVGKFK